MIDIRSDNYLLNQVEPQKKEEMGNVKDLVKYEGNYTEKKFWGKLGSVAKKIGSRPVYLLLLLFYVTRDPNVSKKDKAMIYGALGYFILPLDLIPDAVPGLGYTDDFAAISALLKLTWDNISDETIDKARAKIRDWFGDDVVDEDLNFV